MNKEKNAELKKRIMKVNEKLTKPYKGDFLLIYTKYNSYKQIHKLENVLGLKQVDEMMTEELEIFVGIKPPLDK